MQEYRLINNEIVPLSDGGAKKKVVPIFSNGWTAWVAKFDDEWIITEYITGLSMGSFKTRKEALNAKFDDLLVVDLVNKSIKRLLDCNIELPNYLLQVT